MPRKRARDEADLDSSVLIAPEPKPDGILLRLRNMWEFASLMQYIYFFGRVVKIDEDLDVEELENICTAPDASERLAQIGLTFLKYVSSHRGLTPELFNEYTRRQYLAKAPKRNPFGEEEEPNNFGDLDIPTQIRVLQQLSTWTLGNAERIRSQMEEKDSEQTQWRIEPFGWDSDDRTYFLLDDDRLYRQTDAPLPPTPVKAKSKPKAKKSKSTRSSKRRKLSTPLPDSDADGGAEEEETVAETKDEDKDEDDGFGGMKWECIAVTFDEYQEFLGSIQKSRDPNEKALHKAITSTILPILEKRAEAQRQKALKRQREMENMQKLATAKRSSRIADKTHKQREAEEAAEAEKRHRAELAMAHKEQERQKDLEEARESRMLTREQRLKEREVKRILHEEELARLEEMQNNESQDARMSERNLKNEMERRQEELKKLAEEEDRWIFDCSVCGVHGENIDDGTHSIACERCNIWQHSKCHHIKIADAEREDFHFVCTDCKRKEEDAKKPKIPPLKLGRMGSSSSPVTDQTSSHPVSNGVSNGVEGTPHTKIIEGVSIYRPKQSPSPLPRSHADLMSGPFLSPQGQAPGPPGSRPLEMPPIGIPQPVWQGQSLPPPPRPTSSAGSPPAHVQHSMNGRHESPSYGLHQQAHASAVANNSPYHASSQHANGHANGSMPPPSPHSKSRPSSAYGEPHGAQRNVNGLHGSPSKQQHYSSPMQSSPRTTSTNSQALPPFHLPSQSPHASFPPPHQHYQQQRAAGHSPVKQPSLSPQSHPYQRYSQSPSAAPLEMTTPSTQAHGHAPIATPITHMIHSTPGMASSPIPPVGSGPVIPTKHDTPRPTSRDSVGETPIFPPSLALSPTATENGRGMGVESGEGGLGVGNVPVKKMQEPQPADAVMRDA